MDWNSLYKLLEAVLFTLLSSLITSYRAIPGLLLLTKWKRFSNNRLVIPYIKIIIILHFIPIAYVVTWITRMGWYNDTMIRTSLFGLFNIKKELYIILAVFQLIGIIVMTIKYFIERDKWNRDFKGNVPIEDEAVLQLFNEYKALHGLKHVRIMQNDLLKTAVTAGVARPIIVLPYNSSYSYKELKMILAHEFNHIKSYDLFWKNLAVLTSIIYWNGIFSHMMLKQLDCEQEIECDINTCGAGDEYTKEEYFDFLGGLKNDHIQNAFVSTFCTSKNNFMERMEITFMKVNIKKPSRIAVLLMAMVISTISSVPVYAGMNAMADTYNSNLWVEEYSEQQAADDSSEEYVEHVGYLSGDGVIEVNPFGEVSLLAKFINIGDTIPANLRWIFNDQYMVAGDSVAFSITCSDPNAVFHIGVRNNDSYIYRWVEVTGSILYEFKIDTNASYCAYIYNPGSVGLELSGWILYNY